MNSQNVEEKSETWIGSEYYIQCCFYNMLTNQDRFQFEIALVDKQSQTEIEDILSKAKVIIVPGWTDIPDRFKYFLKFTSKLYSYYYFKTNTLENGLKFFTPYYLKDALSIGFYSLKCPLEKFATKHAPN